MTWNQTASTPVPTAAVGIWQVLGFTPPSGVLAVAFQYTPDNPPRATWDTFGFYAPTIIVDGSSITDRTAPVSSLASGTVPLLASLPFEWIPVGVSQSGKAVQLAVSYVIRDWVGPGTATVWTLT